MDVCNSNSNWQFGIFAVTVTMVSRYHGNFNICVVTFWNEFICRIVTYTEELTSIYICYSTGDWFNTPLSGLITST